MKKAISYFFILSTLLLITCHAFSFEVTNKNCSKSADQDLTSSTIYKLVSVIDSNDNSVFYNYDTDESESNNTSFTRKNTIPSEFLLRSVPVIADIKCFKSFYRGYFSSNFSRLPRFNYILLQVLRL